LSLVRVTLPTLHASLAAHPHDQNLIARNRSLLRKRTPHRRSYSRSLTFSLSPRISFLHIPPLGSPLILPFRLLNPTSYSLANPFRTHLTSLPFPSMLPPPYSPMKHHQSDEEAHSRSDASSHGMGNVADTEMDVSPNGALGAENTRQVREKHSDGTPPPLPPPPAKKKRTRTLTTPHQSAVLHALLAQVGTTSGWGGPLTNRRTSLSVPLSNDCHARGSRPVDWVERSKSPGAFEPRLFHLIYRVDLPSRASGLVPGEPWRVYLHAQGNNSADGNSPPLFIESASEGPAAAQSRFSPAHAPTAVRRVP
jgi:hypothetical protein